VKEYWGKSFYKMLMKMTADGEKYVGSLVDGKANGYGTKYSSNGDIIYRGQWENDYPVNNENVKNV
jgi:hypothetical protein